MNERQRTYPTPDQLASLTRFERGAFFLGDRLNQSRLFKRSSGYLLNRLGGALVIAGTKRLVHVIGVENVLDLTPTKGILVAANHRTFYDQFLVAAYLTRSTRLIRDLYYPVRSDFFYETPTGVLVNLFGAAMSMYPPVFRSAEKRSFNRYGLKRMIELLDDPRVVLGVHPEGTRNKTDDPYQLLPAQPGVGKLIMNAQPHVLPVFVNGLINEFGKQVRSNFNNEGSPIIIVYGKLLALDSFYQRKNTLRVQKELSEHVLAQVAELGAIERNLRKHLESYPQQGPCFHRMEDVVENRLP